MCMLQCRMRGPQRRTYYGSHWYIAWQLKRDVQRMIAQGYTVASKTWIPGIRGLSAVTFTLIVTYHHSDDPTAPPEKELQRVLEPCASWWDRGILQLGEQMLILECPVDYSSVKVDTEAHRAVFGIVGQHLRG